jgi:hypothetical protein
MRIRHTKTLIHASSAPPVAINQLYRKAGDTNRNTSNTSAVTDKIVTVMRMNMQL